MNAATQKNLKLDDQVTDDCFIKLLTAQDVLITLRSISEEVTTTILDPWYNRGVGGVIDDYDSWLQEVLTAATDISSHVFLWGFPDIICRMLDRLPPGTELVAWLTWYYKNCPSVVRGWRSAQYTCLHIGRKGARIYPEHFLNDVQKHKMKEGKLRYMPGPPTVFEAPLNIGFVGKQEQTGHPAQKPISVIEPLILMSTTEGDVVLDPMCGAGTTGVACRRLHRSAILSDMSVDYLELTQGRIEASLDSHGHLCEKYSVKNSNMALFSSSLDD